jgi:tetratricopeptide (TPR) repeat protein
MTMEMTQAAMAKLGTVSDIYALGAILFELLTGHPPFQAETIPQLVRKIVTEPAPSPSQIQPGISAALDSVCAKALAKEPAERFTSMTAFASALAAATGGGRRRSVGMALAAAMCVLLFASAAVFYVKTDHGMIEVRLSDPKANVQVSVDGGQVQLNENGRVTNIRSGTHGLVVEGPDFETVTHLFKVTRGKTTVVEVTLKSKTPGETALRPKTPTVPSNQTRLAGLLARGEQLLSKNEMPQLEQIVKQALGIDPESPGALALRAAVKQMQTDFESAKRDAQAALKLNPETFRAHLVLSVVNFADGKVEDCIVSETIAIRLRPDNPWGWSNRARSYLALKEYRQAIADAGEAIDRRFAMPNALMTRGAAYGHLGMYEKALADYDAAAKMAPHNAHIFDQRALVHARLGNKKNAEEDWKRAEDLDKTLQKADHGALPDPPQAPNLKKLTADEATARDGAIHRVQTAWNEGRLDAAAKAVEDACRIDPTSAVALAWRSRVRGMKGQHAAALEDASRAVRLDPELFNARFAKGHARGATDDPAGAIADLTIALRINATSSLAWNNRGWAYMMRGQYHQALADFNAEINRGGGGDYTARGRCYLHLGDYEKALTDYATASNLQPTNGRWLLMSAAIRARALCGFA